MKLFKNVDINDIKRILNEGIISIDDGASNSWDDNMRAANRTDVVYLFDPIEKGDVFPQYGIVLLEVEVDDVSKSEISSNDYNFGKYNEYIIGKVEPEQIKHIYFPRCWKDFFETYMAENGIKANVDYCNVDFEFWDDKENVEQDFIDNMSAFSVLDFNYFRAERPITRHIIDVKKVKYLI